MPPWKLFRVMVVLVGVACLSAPAPQLMRAGQKVRQAVSGSSERPERAPVDPEEQLARRRLAALEARDPGETLALAEALDAVVNVVWRARRFPAPEHVSFAERAVAIRGRLQPDAPETARSLSRLASFLERTGEWDRAKTCLERGLAIREKTLGPNDLETAKGLSQLSFWYAEMDRSAEALAYARRALAIQEQKLPPDDVAIAETLQGLGRIHCYLGDYTAAERNLRRALVIQEKQEQASGRLAGILRMLANVATDKGDYASARSLYQRSLAALSRTNATNQPLAAIGETAYAVFLADLGERIEARRLYEHALSTFESLGVENSNAARTLVSLGDLLKRNRDYDGARLRYEKALAIFETQIGPDHVWVATCLQKLASLRRDLGDNPGAGDLCRRALAIDEKLRGPDHPDTAGALVELADILAEEGDHAGALTRLQRARGIYEKQFNASHPWVAGVLRSMAGRYAGLGDLDAARRCATRSCTILERTLGVRHPDFAASLVESSRIHWWSGDKDRALGDALRAQAIVRAHIQLTAEGLSEREALRYRSAADDGLAAGLTVLSSRPSSTTTIRQVWDEVVRSRALVLDEMAARHRCLLEAASPASAERARALLMARGKLACLVFDGARALRLADYRERLQAAQEEVERLERKLGDDSMTFRNRHDTSTAGITDVLAALPTGSALVAYVRFARLSETPKSRATAGAAYLALIASAGRLFAVPLGDGANIDAMVESVRAEATNAPADAGASKRFRDVAADLRRAVWDPLVPHLAGAHRVFLVPDAELSLVPLETLPTANDRYLLEEGPEIRYLSAERDLVHTSTDFAPGRGLLVVGGPDFDAGPAPRTPTPRLASLSRGLRFQPLPSALAEIQDVRASWPSGDIAVLSAERADETSFKRLAPGRRVIHVATHGFFASRSDGGDNPLVFSGLAFAGANRIDSFLPEDGDDGILTAGEIAALDFRGVEWVVLSSCESGLGPTQTGEGVLGLQRAFAIAGARTLIVSLWPVGDHDAREWVRGLYAARASGLPAAAAVRRASLDILERRRRAGVTTHPFSWGAFIATGGQ